MPENNTQNFDEKSVYKEIDEVIIFVCEDIKSTDKESIFGEYPQKVCALAELINARTAMLREL